MKSYQTQRLNIEPLVVEDAPFIFTLTNTEGWLTYIGDRGVYTLEDAKNYIINGPQKSYVENGFGLCKMVLRNSMTPIGLVGFIKRPTLPHPDFGFAILPEYYRQGFTLEASATLFQHSHEICPSPTTLAICLETNTASVSLLHKLGFRNIPWGDIENTEAALILFEKSII